MLAHAGPGASWQAMTVVAAVVLAGFLLAAGAGLVRLRRPDDLVLPVAASAILASLGVLVEGALSDLVGWALPVAAVALLALVLGAMTPLDVRFPAPLPMGAVALAVVAAVGLHQPLALALHPPAEVLPLRDDAELDVTVVEPGPPARVLVRVRNGSIGPGGVPTERLPEDPEEAGMLRATLRGLVDGTPVGPSLEVPVEADCPLADPCEQVELRVAPDPGTWQLTVELQRGDGTPLAPALFERVELSGP